MTGMNSEHQKLYRELWGCLIFVKKKKKNKNKKKRRRRRRFASRQTSVFYFFKSFSGTRASPPILLDTGDDDPAYSNRQKLTHK
jgi:hypothetical protein